MPGRGTLKEFAERNGINYQTAKTWWRRGRIAFDDQGFYMAKLNLNETEGVKPETVETQVSNYDPETVSRADCDPRTKTEIDLQRQILELRRALGMVDCATCHGARWACGHMPIEELTLIEVLTKDNRILSDAVDSLRDLTTEQGQKLGDLQRQIDSLRAMVHAMATEHAEFRGRVAALEAETAFPRTRVGEPSPDFTTVTASAPPEWLKRSNYAGSRNDLGEPYFD